MIKNLTIFTGSKKNLISLGITSILICSLYVLYLEVTQDKAAPDHFFGAGFVTIPSLAFFLYYFNGLFRHHYFRFLILNVSKNNFYSYIFKSITALSLMITVVSAVIYFLLNLIYLKQLHLDILLLKNLIVLFLFNFILCSISFIINSFTTSFWAFFLAIFYFLFEDMMVLYLAKKGMPTVTNFLLQNNFLHIFSSSKVDGHYLIPLFYLFFTGIFIGIKNYKIL